MSDVVASASIVVDRPRDAVWNALTDPALVSQYFMGATVKTDWQVGHPITFTCTWKDKPFED
ncbi:MAG: SRPBCC domain-containing protein, partial [Ilumatobacteraceae bacterium]